MPEVSRASAPAAGTYYRSSAATRCLKIAQLFNTTVDKIKSWNRLRGSSISAGTRLLVRGR